MSSPQLLQYSCAGTLLGRIQKQLAREKIISVEPEDKINYFSEHKGAGGLWQLVYPEYVDKRELYDLLLEDLKSKNVITLQHVEVVGVDEPVKWGKGLTAIGKQFVDFITHPG